MRKRKRERERERETEREKERERGEREKTGFTVSLRYFKKVITNNSKKNAIEENMRLLIEPRASTDRHFEI